MSTQGTNEHDQIEGGHEGDTSTEELGGNDGVPYHLPPPQHHLESSSRIQPHNEAGVQFWTSWHPHPHLQNNALGRTQEIQFRGLVSPAAGTNTFYPAPPFSYQIPNTFHLQHQQGGYIHPNYQRDMEADSSLRNVKMRMTMQDNRLPYGGQLQLGSTSFNPQTARQPTQSPYPPRPVRNFCYDPMYEEMGLPVDPHLRMFLARRNQGKD